MLHPFVSAICLSISSCHLFIFFYSLASPPTSSAQPPHSLTLSPPAGATGLASDNNNHLSAAAAAAAAGLNLSDCDPARFAGLSYPRLSAAGGLGYSAAAAAMSAATYPSNEQNPYPSIAMADNSFYGPLVSSITILCSKPRSRSSTLTLRVKRCAFY